MNKRLLLLLVLLTGLAAGCCEPEPSQEPESTKFPLPQPTTKPALALESQDAFCVAEPLNLPVEPRIPPVTEADHVHGPDTAAITIIEYADFQ